MLFRLFNFSRFTNYEKRYWKKRNPPRKQLHMYKLEANLNPNVQIGTFWESNAKSFLRGMSFACFKWVAIRNISKCPTTL